MALLRMVAENYRCFKERQEIELRPITVILGKNNSGKSALTRLPMLLETGTRTDSDFPLDLDSLGDDPPEFLDLVYGRNVHRPLRLEFTTGALELRATIQNIDEQRRQFVSEAEIILHGNRLGLEWIPETKGNSYMMTWNSEEPIPVQVRFRGLRPASVNGAEANEEIREFLRRARPDILFRTHYLSPYRQRPSRLTRLPSRMATDVGAAGENAAGMLVNDHVRGGRALIDKVNELLGTGLDGWSLEVEQQGPLFAVNLRSTTNPELSVNLLDSGTGVAQVLPLVVQQAQDLIGPRSFPSHYVHKLQVVEEPELHLHPAFHALLADLFIEGIRRGGRFLIETHSETLLLRLRRRIAEGGISPDDVAVYFVEHKAGSSQARRIVIDEFGDLDYWPPGVFSEDFEETKELMKAQFEREYDAG